MVNLISGMAIVYSLITILATILGYRRGERSILKDKIKYQEVSIAKLSAFLDSSIASPGKEQFYIDANTNDLEIKNLTMKTVNIALHAEGQLEVTYLTTCGNEYHSKYSLKAISKLADGINMKDKRIVKSTRKYSNWQWQVVDCNNTKGEFFITRVEAEDARDEILISKMNNFSKRLKEYTR